MKDIKTYDQAVDWAAEAMFHDYMGGGHRMASENARAIAFIYNIYDVNDVHADIDAATEKKKEQYYNDKNKGI